MAADPNNGKVDYAEALESLGIPEGTDFHLRVYPVGAESVGTLADQRVAYVANWLTFPTVEVPIPIEALNVDASSKVSLMGVGNALSGEGHDDIQVELGQHFNVTTGPETAAERQALVAAGAKYFDHVYLPENRITVTIDPSKMPPVVMRFEASTQYGNGASAQAGPEGVKVGRGQTYTSVKGQEALNYLGLSTWQGDVFPDLALFVEDALPRRLPDYDVLVVGSSADQSVLGLPKIRNAIAAWVLNGGTLIVLGSPAEDSDFMSPLLAKGTAAYGGQRDDDTAHPVLTEPNVLEWSNYDAHGGQAWRFNVRDYPHLFTQVASEGGQNVLAISNWGSFGQGRVILTSYRDGEISFIQSPREAEHLLENLMLYAQLENATLEYGPAIPDGVQVSSAIRQTQIFDERLGTVALRLELHLWKG